MLDGKERWASLYRNKPASDRKYSRDSIRVMAMTLRALLAEAVRDGHIQVNPVVEAGLSKYYRRKKKDIRVKRSKIYQLEELYAIEDVLKSRREIFGEDYEFSLVMSRTGVRIGEAMGLQPSDVDMTAKTILIERNIPAGVGELEDTTKANIERTVDMGENLHLALKEMFARRRQESLAAGRPTPSAWLFCSSTGDHIDYSRFNEDWKRAQELARVRYRSPHCLRHTYASQQLGAGVPITDVSQQLGHADAATTLAIYAHFIPKKSGRTRNALDRTRSETDIESKEK